MKPSNIEKERHITQRGKETSYGEGHIQELSLSYPLKTMTQKTMEQYN